jgi:hypothetical protein
MCVCICVCEQQILIEYVCIMYVVITNKLITKQEGQLLAITYAL